MRVNLTSAYRLAHVFRPHLLRSALDGGASVIGIASMTSYFGVEVVPGYGAAKGALVQLTKTLAGAWARDGIRVNAVAPGFIESRMMDYFMSVPELTNAALDARRSSASARRPISPARFVPDERRGRLLHRADAASRRRLQRDG